jgi:hypothetical protein
MTNTARTILIAIQASRQFTFFNQYLLYNPLVNSRNGKNKQLTLLNQRKLALTTINKRFLYKIIGDPKKFRNQPHPLVRPSPIKFLSTIFNLPRDTVPLTKKIRKHTEGLKWNAGCVSCFV